jgi:hypothetical protein
MLEVRYLETVPRLAYGSNLAAHWGHLYQEMEERERVAIYQVDAQANLAIALVAYDVAEKYLTPGRITDCSQCKCERVLRDIRVPVRRHLGTAGVAPTYRAGSAAFRRVATAATSTTGTSGPARRCTTPSRCRAHCPRR